ncbi:UNVERIFIED_CONTAM: hypothetical protein PYX00_008424 [Menopon gallinae]|uniref:DNA repair and recombination protein RAD54-like n=1 Tax=Menopon gallinae TaxID=328185 RepID=A0AAW2HNA9_9NEOP
MRRSKAPSFKNVEKPAQRPKLEEGVNYASPEVKRGTSAVLSLLLGGNENDQPNVNSQSCDILENKGDDPKGCANEKNGDFTIPTISGESTIFNVVYAKQSQRKHKVWEGDGTLEVGAKFMTLKDEKGKVIGTAACSKSKVVEEGSRLLVGSKEVEVIEVASKNFEATKEVSPDKQVVKKRKISICKKRFVTPSLHSLDRSKSGFLLPEPNPEHQWNFNKDDLPVTQVCVEGHLARNLRQHQCIGVTFLYECVMGFKSNDISGAILADEMGLGKTLQTITLIWTLLKQGPYGNKPVVRKVLVVTPSSLTMNWHKEFIKWLGREKLVPYVIDSKNKPQDMRGPVMIISYEMFVRYYDDIKNISFDLLVCDEGHRLKNSNIRTTQLLRSLNCPRRILLTGTPIQNDLKEFYTLVDFVNPNILGTALDFRIGFEEPILSSREPFADDEVRLKGEECAADLNRKTSLFLLRRTKEVLDDYLPSKCELVVFCKLTELQREIYNYLINALIDNKELGYSEGLFHFSVLTNLKKVCNHPGLLFTKDAEEDVLLSKINNSFRDVRGNFHAENSSKFTVVCNFLSEMKQNYPRERVVLVSNSTQTLDLLEKLVADSGYTSCRLDGSTPASQRAGIVEKFNRPNSPIFVFLLSSKAGGVGLNLTGASRLILFDSDWNPATDLQAMSRIWRDGQKTSVYIYRLLTAGTIEEKIYQRQINKQGLCDGIVDPQKTTSIKLSEEEVKDIFSYCESRDDCSTHEMLSCNCSRNGEIPVIEEEERTCQLMKTTKSVLKMNELLQWEHHGSPVNPSLLSELCLLKSEDIVNFIFRNCKR